MGNKISIGCAFKDQDLDGSTITGSTIDSSAVGSTTAAAGAFTTLTASGAATLNGNVAIGNATTDLVGFHGATAVDQGTALTTQLTAITIADAAGTPDYALQALTTTSPYGLATAAEAITLLYVIQNLQVRMAEVEQRLEEKGLIAAN